MNQDEVNKAAERTLTLRRNNVPKLPTYYDLAILADAYLAERDPTPVDESWLLSIGFVKGGSPNARLIFIDYFTIDNLETGECSVCGWCDRVPLNTRCKTRGQVLQLLRCLGVEQKEQE